MKDLSRPGKEEGRAPNAGSPTGEGFTLAFGVFYAGG